MTKAVMRRRTKLLAAMTKFPAGETRRIIYDAAGISNAAANQVFADLIQDGLIVECEVPKKRRIYDGYRLKGIPFNEVRMKKAIVEYPYWALEELLQLPDGVHIEFAHAPIDKSSVIVRLVGDNLPDRCRILEGSTLVRLTPEFASRRVPMFTHWQSS